MNSAPDCISQSSAGFHLSLLPGFLRLCCDVVFVLSLAHSGCSDRSGLRKRRRGICEARLCLTYAALQKPDTRGQQRDHSPQEKPVISPNVTQYRLNAHMDTDTLRTRLLSPDYDYTSNSHSVMFQYSAAGLVHNTGGILKKTIVLRKNRLFIFVSILLIFNFSIY